MLKLKVGETYISRDGRLYKIKHYRESSDFPYRQQETPLFGDGWKEDGFWTHGQATEYDLVTPASSLAKLLYGLDERDR